jgi:hypothetical protein
MQFSARVESCARIDYIIFKKFLQFSARESTPCNWGHSIRDFAKRISILSGQTTELSSYPYVQALSKRRVMMGFIWTE